MNNTDNGTEFSGLIDLAAERFGGRALLASDEFFAGRENLLKAGRGVFLPDEYTDRGKWMDGWEPRRRRSPGHDWCLIELGVPGTVRAVNVDTNHFLGNHPPFASVDAVHAPGASPEALRDEVQWTPIVPQLALKAGSENLGVAVVDGVWTHLRLNIYPAGGVARFRAWGHAEPEPAEGRVNLAALERGALALCCSDMFFSPMNNLLEPNPADNMGQGWESRRGRPPTDDWVVVRLTEPGLIDEVLLDTAFFKGNYPESCEIQALYWPDAPAWALVRNDEWRTISAQVPLRADAKHTVTVSDAGPWTHVRLCIYPDGGVSRMRVLGRPSALTPSHPHNDVLEALRGMDDAQLSAALARCCGASRWVEKMTAARPLRSATELFGEAERIWWSLGDGDWLEAFTHHPKIGADVDALRAKFSGTADLSEKEQAGIAAASEETLEALAEANRVYEERFGFIFIVCASGKSAAEMLELCRGRLGNEPAYELRVAAGEQAKITKLRLLAITGQ